MSRQLPSPLSQPLPPFRPLPLDEAEPTSGATPSGAEHLDGIPLEEPAGADQAEAAAPIAGEVLTPTQFRQGLAAAFALSGALVGLRTLVEAPGRAEFPPAADALYQTATESPWLRWLISPQSVWLQRAVAIGAFAVPVAAGVAAELRERRRPAPPDDGQAAA